MSEREDALHEQVHIQVIVGSTREGRVGERVARWFMGVAEARDDMRIELIDLRDWDLPFFHAPMGPASGNYTPEARAWADKVGPADGYVIVTPEYNHAYPAVLKNALDHIYAEWNNKPVGFVSYGGGAGGTRAVEQLRLVAIELQMAPIRAAVMIPMARAAIGEDATPADLALNERATQMLDQLAWWGRTLRAGRHAM
jgi:NAD(P)H-dependent FMN reductase